MDSRPPTLRDLAAKLGVSHATVSMALRNHPSISEATRKRVQAAARKAGYQGNVLVSALLTQVRRGRVEASAEVIAFLEVGSGADNTSALRPDLLVGLEAARRRARQLGLTVESFAVGVRGGESRSVGRTLFNRGIRGVVITPMPLDLLPLEIDWRHHSVVAVGYSYRQDAMHRVANAHFSGILCAYERLRACGHRRIGCVLRREEDARSLHYWRAGALAGPHLHGGAVILPLMLDEPAEARRGEFERWFRKVKPDAVVANYPDFVLGWLREMGMASGRGNGTGSEGWVSYASLDVTQGSGVSGIGQSWGGMFATAVDQLGGELARNEFGLPEEPKVTLVEGKWVEGATVRMR
ncbi:LacI family transcriptional regulator [Opitutaceae bacterium TAV4]|nr:LacI family transcriptional regulator [Opitutaceae bacterium TAV4]RRK01602.1 LacI family transcriptional regulator [Opitutaceae bacterium TAV3]